MRLHTDLLGQEDLEACLMAAGLKRKGVWMDVCKPFGSRTHARAFEVRLAAKQRPGRRYTNTGKYGSGGNYAATYDEWGYWMAEVFRRDRYAKFGPYNGSVDFHEKTENFYLTDDGLPEPFSVPSREVCHA